MRKNYVKISNSACIPKDELTDIFKRFYRSNNNYNTYIKGTGLGLSIVKRLSELLHLKLSVSSENNWTEFVIEF